MTPSDFPLESILCAARGDVPADLLLENGRLVNLFSAEIVSTDIAVASGHIIGFGKYDCRKRIDLKGRFVCPGFIDAHVHIESSMAGVPEFARAVLPKGTTTVVADPHEIANVLGTEGIQYMLRASCNLPMNIYFTLPSCVPATDLETSGAVLSAQDLRAFMGEERICALAEMMNFPGVIHGALDVLEKIRLAREHRKPVDGHAPGLRGADLSAYIAAGISSDHECTDLEEAAEKLAAGMHIMIREGTGAKNLKTLLQLINERNQHRILWCTDDRHPHDLMDEGHIDSMVREAIRSGLDPITAIRIGTINPARYFNLHHLGAIAPGRQADLLILSDLEKLRIESVYHRGELVAEGGKAVADIPSPSEDLPTVMRVPEESIDFSLPAEGRSVRAIELVPGQLLTKERIMEVSVSGGLAVSDISRDLLKIAVIERYTGRGGKGIGFVKGLGLKRGALASSVAHDSHNIIVAGVEEADMRAAVKAVIEMGGGLAAVCREQKHQLDVRLPLPIAGLMSPEPVNSVRKKMDRLIQAAHDMGTHLPDPFMALSFLALPVIPDLKITDKGLVDVSRFSFVSVFTD